MKKRRFFSYIAETLGAVFYLGLLRILPVDAASALGGIVLRVVGPCLSAHRTADKNLRRVFPEKSDAWIQETLKDMWDNLGRTIGELPHLSRIMDPKSDRVHIKGGEHVQALAADDVGGIFFSAHLANWELAALMVAREGLPLHLFYRPPNNPFMHWLFKWMRRGNGTLLPKSAAGARHGVSLLRAREHLGMLIDQKMNDGVSVPFLGHMAMTNPTLGRLAIKYKVPVVPTRVIREKGAYFTVVAAPPLFQGEENVTPEQLTAAANDILSTWIREKPGQWFWVHQRWPNKESISHKA